VRNYKIADRVILFKNKKERRKHIGRSTHVDLASSNLLGMTFSDTGKYIGVGIFSVKMNT
jgi:hypothetical protein